MAIHTETAQASWLGPERRPLTMMLSTSFISMISNQLTALAVPWFVLVLTGSAAKMGLTAVATMLPSVIMLFLGGAIADRVRPRGLSIFSDVLSGVTVALVPLLYAMGHLNFPMLLVLMVAGAVFDTPGYSARSKLLPQLAERAAIPIERVTSVQGIMQAVSTLFGAILAGTLIAWVGATNVLWINAAAFAVSAVAMLAFIPDLYIRREDTASIMDDIRFGLRYVWQNTMLRTLIIGVLLVNAFFAPMLAVLLPYMAKMEWESSIWYGVAISGFGAGALIGSILFGQLSEKIKRSTIFKVALVLFGPPTLVFATVPAPWLAAGVGVLIGLGSGLVNPMFMAMMYRITRQEVLGRVMGVMNAGSMLASPAGVLLATPLLDQFGLGVSYLVFAVALNLVTGALLLHRVMAQLDTVDAEPATP